LESLLKLYPDLLRLDLVEQAQKNTQRLFEVRLGNPGIQKRGSTPEISKRELDPFTMLAGSRWLELPRSKERTRTICKELDELGIGLLGSLKGKARDDLAAWNSKNSRTGGNIPSWTEALKGPRFRRAVGLALSEAGRRYKKTLR